MNRACEVPVSTSPSRRTSVDNRQAAKMMQPPIQTERSECPPKRIRGRRNVLRELADVDEASKVVGRCPRGADEGPSLGAPFGAAVRHEWSPRSQAHLCGQASLHRGAEDVLFDTPRNRRNSKQEVYEPDVEKGIAKFERLARCARILHLEPVRPVRLPEERTRFASWMIGPFVHHDVLHVSPSLVKVETAFEIRIEPFRIAWRSRSRSERLLEHEAKADPWKPSCRLPQMEAAPQNRAEPSTLEKRGQVTVRRTQHRVAAITGKRNSCG